MAIINPLVYTIKNGDPVDATPVQANFAQIVQDVNANAALVGGNASQQFLVAPATVPSAAVPLNQVQQLIVGGGGGGGGLGAIDPSAKATEGAVGDNIADDTTALQKLVSIIGTNWKLEAGKYKLSGTAGVGALQISYANGGMYAFDGQPMPGALYGAGPQNSILCPTTTGMYAVQSSSTATASIMGVRYHGFCVSGRNNIHNVNGLYLDVVEMQTLENLRFEQLNIGLYLDSVEYLTLRKCLFEGNVNGIVSTKGADGFTHLNASTFQDVILDRNTANGLLVTDNAANLTIEGGQVSNNGTMGVSGTAGLNITVSSVEGANGVTIKNVYFELNNGDADIKIVNTGTQRMTHIIQGCNFNRVSGTNYTTNNIVSRGPNTILLIGCSFQNYGDYSPSASRPFLNGDSQTQFVDLGCWWGSTPDYISVPAFPPSQMYLVPSSSPTLSSSPSIVPMQKVDSYGTALSTSGGGVKVSLPGYYRVYISLQVNAAGAGLVFVGAAVNGATPVIAANSAYTPSAMAGIIIQATAVIHLNADDVVYVGGEAPAQATVVQNALASWMAIEGPI
jgi:hypothetical protein